MKSKMYLFLTAVLSAAVLMSCSEEDEPRKGDPDISHVGVKWKITSIESYVLSEVGTSGITNKTGTVSNAGFFYFNETEKKGSFEFTIAGYNKEDRFAFEKKDDGSIIIVTVDQSVGATTNQNILAISGTQLTETEIVLDAVSIMNESSSTGIFTFSATSIKLTKD